MNKAVFFTFIFSLSIFNNGKSQVKYSWTKEIEKEKVFKSMSEALSDPQAVKRLDLSNQNLKELPQNLCKLTELIELNLYRNDIEILPREIACLTKLKVLNLTYNKLSHLPDEIGKLKNLKQLTLWGNKLVDLPAAIGNLSRLEVLELYDNQLKELPAGAAKLTDIKVLNIGANPTIDIEKVFSVIKSFKKLEKLSLANNALVKLPVEISNLNSLEELELVNNELTTLPPEIGKLVNLEKLILGEAQGSYNKIDHLPKEFGNLKNLTELYLSNNQLDSVPQSVCKLYKLKVLDLSYNHISSVTDQIGNLENLEEVNFSHNRLAGMPSSISNWKKLKSFIRDDNPIVFKEEEKIVGWLSKVKFSNADSVEVASNYSIIESVIYEFYEHGVSNPDNIKITVMKNKVICERSSKSPNEKYISKIDFNDLQRLAYWFVFKYYNGKTHYESTVCDGGTTSVLTVNGSLGFGHDGCTVLEFENEFDLIVRRLMELCE